MMASSMDCHPGLHHHHGARGRRAGAEGERAGDRRRLGLTLALVLAYMVAEVIGGVLTNSLALLADAGHMLSDAGALGLSLFAASLAARPLTPRQSYGYYRAEILAALANGAALMAIAIYIVIEAVQRIGELPDVQGGAMLAIALGGLAVNLCGLWILSGSRSGSLNLRGAWLHVLTDAVGSVAAILAGCLIWAFGWNWADPAASLMIAALLVHSAWGLVREAVAVLMESTPKHIDPDQVRQAISDVAGVRGVHDLHIWVITTGMEALSAHAVVEDGVPPETAVARIREILAERFGIGHVTIQIEAEECGQCGAVI
jgi:cobalt-zinc-cadmium efflux system protein